MVTCDPEDLQSAALAASNGSTHIRGSSRRKSSTPRRLSSSSSSDCPVKRPCLDSTKGRPSSPEVQAFTCAPLPLEATPSSEKCKMEEYKVMGDVYYKFIQNAGLVHKA